MQSAVVSKKHAELQQKLAGATSLDESLHLRITFCSEYQDSLNSACEEILLGVLSDSLQHRHQGGEMMARLSLAYIYFDAGRMEEAMRSLEAGAKLMEQAHNIDPFFMALAKNYMAYFQWFRGEYAAAFNLIFDTIRAVEQFEDKRYLAWLHYALGVFNSDIKDIAASDDNFIKARDNFQSVDYRFGYARSVNGLASNLIAKGREEEAEQMLHQVLVIYRDMEISSGSSRTLHDLAIIYKNRKDYARALSYLHEAIAIRESTGHKQGLTTSLIELGEILLLSGQSEEGRKKTEEGLKLAVAIGNKAKAARAHQLLSKYFKSVSDHAAALEHFEKFHALQEELLGQSASNQIKKNQAQFEKEKAEREAVIHKLKNVELKSAYEEIEKKNKELYRLSLVASETNNAIVIMDAEGNLEWLNEMFTRFSGKTLDDLKAMGITHLFHISKNDNVRRIFQEVIDTRQPISYESCHMDKSGKAHWLINTLTPVFSINGDIRNFIIIATDISERKLAEEIIRQKNEDITDSIKYARRIQYSLLTSEMYIEKCLKRMIR